jgi:Na+-translocating membrane potential-generating system MpsC-like protein
MDEVQQPRIGYSDRQGLELQEITNAIVRLYKELFGRGPTKARTNYAGPDTLVATLENSLTPAERNMLELDEHQRVREISRAARRRLATPVPGSSPLQFPDRRNRGPGPMGTGTGAACS